MNTLVHIPVNWLTDQGLSGPVAAVIGWIVLSLVVILLALLSNYIARRVLLVGVQGFVRRSRTKWDDALLERKVFTRLSHIAPIMVIYFTAPLFGVAETVLQRLSQVYILVVGLSVANGFLSAVTDIYDMYAVSRNRPIKGYIQVIQIALAVFAAVFAFSLLLSRSPWVFLSGLGAMTAVLILVFKDSILGLVAGVQLTQNDMVRIGDWIEMPKYGADGDVIDVTLNTIKVQNWDKTITTIPAYAMVSDSFKNWRGMSESGGRRIKRAIYIDVASIKFCTEEMLARFGKFQLIADYLRARSREIQEYNEQHGVDTTELVNGRRMTNVGVFRAYVVAYLRSHPKVRQDMTFIVRQLPPGEHGLPIEVYVFCTDQAWANYEAIQADIFDHLLAVVPLFDLRVFQNPSGHDVRILAESGGLGGGRG